MNHMIKKFTWVVVALSLVGFASASSAQGDLWNKKTVLTFSQPVEIPGHVLPAGTYTFQLADTMGDRHIVQVFDATGTRIIATVIAIPDHRMTATDKTVITFGEVPVGSPEVIRAWYYPGNKIGNSFVYPRKRALELAQALRDAVPAITVDAIDADALKMAPIVTVAPDAQEKPVAVVMAPSQTTRATEPADESGTLPQTAGTLPLIALLGVGLIGAALFLARLGRRSKAVSR